MFVNFLGRCVLVCLFITKLSSESRLIALESPFFCSGQEVPLSPGLSMRPSQLPSSEGSPLLGPCCLKQDHRASRNAENILLSQISGGGLEQGGIFLCLPRINIHNFPFGIFFFCIRPQSEEQL